MKRRQYIVLLAKWEVLKTGQRRMALITLCHGILYSYNTLGFHSSQADCGWIGELGPGPSYGIREGAREKLESATGFDSVEFTNKNTTFI